MEETNETGYGKKSLWQWVLIYVVIGTVVYGLIYYFVMGKKGGYNSSSGSSVKPAISQPASTTGTTANQENSVTLTSDGYSPATLTIKTGATVTWTNKSGANATVNSDPHPTHTDYPPLNLGRFADGGTLSLKFDKPGTYGYHNHLDASQKGKIVVQ